MKKNILVQIGIDDNNKPIMQSQYVEITEDEIAEMSSELPNDSCSYDDKVDQLIRKRYSLSEELAILRQRDSKPQEFAEYYAYAEECKTKSKL